MEWGKGEECDETREITRGIGRAGRKKAREAERQGVAARCRTRNANAPFTSRAGQPVDLAFTIGLGRLFPLIVSDEKSATHF